MDNDEIYERFGLAGNPFQNNSTSRLESITISHANLKIDDELALLKEQVFNLQKKAVIGLSGIDGMGKTERALVAQKEAENNDIFCVPLTFKNDTKHAMKYVLDTISPKGSTLLSNDKWERIIAASKKKIKNGYNPNELGNAIATALNENAPSFFVIDDFQKITYTSDSDSFISSLCVAIDQSNPGVFLLITGEQEIFNQILNRYSEFKSRFSRLINLEPLDDSDVAKILAGKLTALRLVNGLNPIYPFTPDSINYLNEKYQGNPKDIIAGAKIALSSAAYKKEIMVTEEITEDSIYLVELKKLKNDYSRIDESSVISSVTIISFL
jgi:hypothetical protein